MKSHLLEWSTVTTRDEANWLDPVSSLNRLFGIAGKVFIAAIPALAIMVGAAWAITVPHFEMIVQASVWAAGFIFLALAVESGPDESFGWTLITGLMLPLLAVLSSRVASEFLVIAAAVIATWTIAIIFRHKR